MTSLDEYAVKLADKLTVQTPKLVGVVNLVLSLLENFKYQIKKLDQLQYCDHELAFICYRVSECLAEVCKKLSSKSHAILINDLAHTLLTLHPKFLEVQRCFKPPSVHAGNSELYLTKTVGFDSSSTFDMLDTLKHSDIISPNDLNMMLRSTSLRILLIDFRSEREFSYSHINFSDVVNIEPRLISDLLKEKDSSTDRDLEVAISKVLSQKQVEKFRRRHAYDLVVLYNLKFGLISDDKFKSLEYSLINGKENCLPRNPFHGLIELLMFRTQYLSSRLKQFPIILNGGLRRWYQSFGDAGLTDRKHAELRHISPNVDEKNIQSVKYMKSFEDYFTKSVVGLSKKVPTNAEKDKHLHKMNNSDSRVHEISPIVIDSLRSIDSDSRIVENKVEKNDATESEPDSCIFNCTTGLTNLGNSCYMNCVLQCLAATPPLTSFFIPNPQANTSADISSYKQHINRTNILGSKGTITITFVELLSDMFRKSGSYFSPTKFKKIIGSLSPGRQFAGSSQQDCIEFLNFILDSLHEDLNQRAVQSNEEKAAIMDLSAEQERTRELLPVRLASAIEWERYLKLNFSVIVDYFQGQYLSQLRCLECHITSTTFNSFSILSIPIPEKMNARSVSLFECLDLFVETELLDDDNKWHCPNCKRFTKSTKQITISRLPRILIIHFKRFKINAGQFKKVETLVSYPVNEILEMTKYWPRVGSYSYSGSHKYMTNVEEEAVLSHMPNRSQEPPFNYTLYGVVNHFGNLTTGHYTSYVKKSDNHNQTFVWRYFDDAKVNYHCKESDVLNSHAYCLFYQRI